MPVEHAERLIKAMNKAGAGKSGDYEGCGWSVAGEGRFTPLENAKPFIGAVGADERVNEIKYETIVSTGKLEDVIAAIYANHPYEQPAFDIYSLENNEPSQGMGRVGELENEMPLVQFVEHVRNAVGASGAIRGRGTAPYTKSGSLRRRGHEPYKRRYGNRSRCIRYWRC